MSKLIYEGNSIENFGEYFPTPYIDKIYIDSIDFGVVKLTVQASFLFDLPSSLKSIEDPLTDPAVNKSVLDTLTNYYFYVLASAPPANTPQNMAIIDKQKQHAAADAADPYDFDNLKRPTMPREPYGPQAAKLVNIKNPYNSFELISYNPALIGEIAHYRGNKQQVGDSFFPIDGGVFAKKFQKGEYSIFTVDGTNKILKITANAERNIKITTTMAGSKHAPSDLYVYAFSSLKPPSQLFDASNPGYHTLRFKSLHYGNIAYEKVLQAVPSGETRIGFLGSLPYRVPDQTQVVYYDSQNILYDEVPMRSIDMRFRKVSSSLRKEIKQKFNDIIRNYQPMLNDEKNIKGPMRIKTLTDSVTTLQSVLAKDSEGIMFLVELNKARRMFLERSTGTPAGQFYEDVGIQLQRANAIVGRQPEVYKRLVSNSKIVDRRLMSGIYELPSGTKPLNGTALFPKMLLDRTVVTTKQISTKVSFASYDVAAGTRFQTYVDGIGANEFDSFDDDDYYMLQLPDGTIYQYDDYGYDGLLNDNYFALEEYNVSFGYTFFDYDSCLRANSYIAGVFDVGRVIEFFGMPFIQAYFQPMNIEIGKYLPKSDGVAFKTPHKDEIAIYNFPLSSVDYTILNSKDQSIFRVPSYGFGNGAMYYGSAETDLQFGAAPVRMEEYSPGGDTIKQHGTIQRFGPATDRAAFPHRIDLSNGTIINTYVAQRPLNMTHDGQRFGESTVGDLTSVYGPFINTKYVNNLYRLMAFEFQNIDQMATLRNYMSYVEDRYRVKIKIRDGTKQAVQAIIDNFFTNMMNYYENYVLLAREFCSYNNLDEKFNDFFIDGINARYIEDPSSSPWVYGVSLYIKHLEFLTNRFSGNQSTQLLEAKRILRTVQPETATLQEVEAFFQLLLDFYETYYGPTSKIGKFLAKSRDPDGKGLGDPYHREIFDLEYEKHFDFHQRASFVVKDRENYLSAINNERQRYLEADEAYANAVANSMVPKLEEEPSLSFGTVTICPATDPTCPRCSGKKYYSSTQWTILQNSSVNLLGGCYCPPGQVENASGICEYASLSFTPLSIDTSDVCTVDEDKVYYEAQKIKKRSPYSEKDDNDCQYVEWTRRFQGAYDMSGYYWYKPRGLGRDRGEFYNQTWGAPSPHAMKKRKILCEGRGRNKKCNCYHKRSGEWRIENTSTNKVKEKIRDSLKCD